MVQQGSVLFAGLCAVLLAAQLAAGQEYISKGYVPPPLSGGTRCVKALTGNTPALCPQSAGVPLTDEGKPGSTVCVKTNDGRSYEGVFSLSYPAPNAVPWCTSDSQCGSNPSVLCATNGVDGVAFTCFPLAPSGCPFTGDTLNSTATAGRKLRL